MTQYQLPKLIGWGLLSLLGASACGDLESTDTSSTPEALTLVPGSSIVSSIAKPDQTYLSSRTINSLVTLGAVSSLLESVARRVDGIIDAKPSNGNFSTDELERMERPEYFATLFPEEKAVFPLLWDLLLAPAAPPDAVPAPARLSPSAVDQSVAPSTLHVPTVLPITELPSGLRASANRLELVLNEDANAATVSLTDVTQALAAPGRFTPEDITALDNVRKEFMNRGTTDISARLAVPSPGVEREVLGSTGPLTLSMDFTTSFSEKRGAYIVGSACSVSIANFTESRKGKATLSLSSGAKVLFILENGDEKIYSPGAFSVPAGAHVAEVWDATGKRIHSARLNTPALQDMESSLDIKGYADYDLVTPNTTLLRKLTTSTGSASNSNSPLSVTASYEVPSASTSAYSWPSSVATQTYPVTIAGRYPFTIDGQTSYLDLYPQGAAVVRWGNQSIRLDLTCMQPDGRAVMATSNGVQFLLWTASRTLVVYRNSISVLRLVLDPSTRVG